MINSEFQMGESERPILETEAENTRLKGTKVFIKGISEHSQWKILVWKVLAPIVITVIGGVLLYYLLR
jgi:hypothetical protein